MTEAEIDLILRDTRHGINCPVSGDLDAAVRDAIKAGFDIGRREAATPSPKPPPRECKPMPAVTEDGWSEWTHPLEPYFMQCCDCGLVHEAEFRIVKDKVYKPDGSFDAIPTSDPTLEVIFRMRREQ